MNCSAWTAIVTGVVAAFIL
jgi:hypothetical protein